MMAQKILIVEDELTIEANLAMQIESFGYQMIETIPRAEEVLSFLINNTPYIILLDINLKSHMAVQIKRQGYNDFKWLPEEKVFGLKEYIKSWIVCQLKNSKQQ